MLAAMTVSDWIAVASFLLAVQATVVGSALWVAKKNAEAMAAGPAAVHQHELDCVNHEPNTSVKIQALREHG